MLRCCCQFCRVMLLINLYCFIAGTCIEENILKIRGHSVFTKCVHGKIRGHSHCVSINTEIRILRKKHSRYVIASHGMGTGPFSHHMRIRRVRVRMGVKTLRTQDTSDPRHFGISAEVSERHFGTKEDTSAPRYNGWQGGRLTS